MKGITYVTFLLNLLISTISALPIQPTTPARLMKTSPEELTTTPKPWPTTTPEPWTTTTMGPTTTTYPINVQCKPSEDGKPVFIPHPFECAKYFECQFQGGAISMSCPDGLVFDPDLEICNWPWLVDCTNTPYPTLPTTTM